VKIELFLNRVSFEKASKSGDIAFNGWDHGPASGDPDVKFTLPLISLREEQWGGLFVYGPSGQVYTVDREAYDVLSAIRDGRRIQILSEADPKKMKEFGELVSRHKLSFE
jgi:hypothetical protein